MTADPQIRKRDSQTYVPDEDDEEDIKHREEFKKILESKTEIRPISVTVTRIDDTETEEMRKDAERR
jgi:aspartate-semialdehyde dehydrogenase